MAKNKVSEWNSNPASNTDVGGIDINEGCAPSGINNAIREVMAQVKDMQAGLDGDDFTVGGNLSVTGTTTLSGGLVGTIPIANGGTNATTASDARTNLGLGTIATQAANNVTITGGSITGITDLAVADGGTGASTLTANAVLLGNGTSAIQAVAPSTSGNVLTSDGTTWTSATPNNSSMTLLGNVTTTSGSSVTLSGLTLTGYIQLYIGYNSSNTSTGAIRINGVQATDNLGASGLNLVGFGNIDLNNRSYIGYANDSNNTPNMYFIRDTNISTSSTSITFTLSTGNFDAGSIRVYGVK